MSEAVQFWLDNKMSDGLRVASIGSQLLVMYRDRYYVVEKGAAQMKGGKPLRFSLSSMPLVWKKALRGDAPSPEALQPPEDDALPLATVTKRERPRKEPREQAAVSVTVAAAPAADQAPAALRSAAAARQPGTARPAAGKPVAQALVAACCPECRCKHDLPLDKGKNGRPFFVTCSRCKAEFAVRFVPVTVYQAQVAGFR